MNTNSHLHVLHRAVLGALATCALAALPSSARTVYDAGKALRENCETGGHANPYGVWSYHLANNAGVIKTTATLSSTNGEKAYGSGTLDGFSISTAQAGSIRTIVSGSSIATTAGEPLEVDELFMFPENHEEKFPMVRFTAPAAGWYSAYVSAHDLAKDETASGNSGVRLRVFAQGSAIIHGIVSLEDYAASNPTRRFDFQMPVRYLGTGETIDVVVDRNGANSNDPTGVKFIVTKEDEGLFYDSGIAMTNSVASDETYTNPYGNIKDGTWYYLRTSVPNSSVDFVSWAPENFGHGTTTRIETKGTRSTGLKGFGRDSSANSPYVVVNTGASVVDNTAPSELQAHPYGSDATIWTTIRFRPPESGYYSASVVARDTSRNSSYNGVDVYLLVSERVVTNAYISAETFSSTAHLAFDARLMVAGEPVDIVVSPHTQASSDATAISAIFRRENGDIYDAGKSYYDVHAYRGASEYFSDSFDSAANWLVAKKSDPWAEAHSSLSTYLTPSGTMLTWWTHATGTSNNGVPPRFAMATNAIASADSIYLGGTSSLLLATTPYELVTQTQNPSGSDSGSASLRAEVPSNGIYRVRSYARDLNGNTGSDDYDGVCVIVSAGRYAPASAVVSRDNGATYPYEAALSADRLWMKQGEAFYFTVDPRTSNYSDSTGLSACYVLEDAAPTAHVVNIDIAGAGTGRFSNYVGAGREGWSDWNKWNALRLGTADSAVVKSCREADGTTRRNVSLSITRSSGSTIATTDALTGCAMLDAAVASSGADDGYAFTLSKLEPNAAYVLYFYGAGDAAFTIGGEMKALDEPWCAKDANVIARFDATADANGQITGTFSATSANGAAFGGVTIVGEFPDYIPESFILVVR